MRTNDQASSGSICADPPPSPSPSRRPPADWAQMRASELVRGYYALRGRDAIRLRDEIAKTMRHAASLYLERAGAERAALQICRDRSDWMRCKAACDDCLAQARSVIAAMRRKA